MATGDVNGNMERVRAALRSVRYPGANAEDFGTRAGAGDPGVFLHALHHTLLVFSRHVAASILKCGYELHAKTDMRFMECVQKLLASEFSYRMSLTPRQFFSNGFAERKMMLVHDVVQLCRRKHNEMARKVRGQQLMAKKESVAAFRHSKLSEVHNETIHVKVSAAGSASPAIEQEVYHVGPDGDGKLKRKSMGQNTGSSKAAHVAADRFHDSSLLRSRSAADVPRPHAKGSCPREVVDEDADAGQLRHGRRHDSSGDNDDDDERLYESEAVHASVGDDGDSWAARDPAAAYGNDEEPPCSRDALADEMVRLEFLDRIRGVLVQACGSLETKIEAVHGHTNDMDRRLAARLTLLEGRIKFLEHKRGLPIERSACSLPLEKEVGRLQTTGLAHSAEREVFDDQPFTPPIREHESIHASRAAPFAAHSKLPTTLPTSDFIAAVEENFRKARKMVSEM